MYFERRIGVGHQQGHLCSHSVTCSHTTPRLVLQRRPSSLTSPAEWKDLVYGEHIVSMNDNGMQSDITRRPLGRDRQRIAGAA